MFTDEHLEATLFQPKSIYLLYIQLSLGSLVIVIAQTKSNFYTNNYLYYIALSDDYIFSVLNGLKFELRILFES